VLVLDLTLALPVLLGGFLYFRVTGRLYLSVLVAGLCLSCGLAVGILNHDPVTIGEAAVGLAAFAVFWWWNGRGKRRKRARKELGDESRQLRDGLVRRLRERRVTRRKPSPLPS
jgi:hypothetical protein